MEVLLRSEPGQEPGVELVEYSWGSGLGWYPRQRLTLDTAQATELALLLSAQYTPQQKPGAKRPRPAIEQDGNVIQLLFPGT